ncbi:uncharacterized protein LOC115098503 [Rhinatrema bivittatum]|uniref:uncharacterized protein LOC115098503 n=1 Tax=Rhinatrema bivittatum TaxID=194408 RepID=UPI00112A0830|nr:uncharacterized protein LOC115098503 [Rhinatrema bivittatum]
MDGDKPTPSVEDSPLPAVAMPGPRRTAQEGDKEHDAGARRLVEKDFHVDDEPRSLPIAEEAILASTSLRLHEMAPDKPEVMRISPPDDHARNSENLVLRVDTPPLQRNLGLNWDPKSDAFMSQISTQGEPHTHQGVPSTVNSLHNPLEFVTPATTQGRALLRELSSSAPEWDTPLLPARKPEWEKWKSPQRALEQFHTLRTHVPTPLNTNSHKEICNFSDTAVKAIAAVGLWRATGAEGTVRRDFIFGKVKPAPQPNHSIPRLESCGAALAEETVELTTAEKDIRIDAIRLRMDSQVVRSYIYNQTRRFHVYAQLWGSATRIRSDCGTDFAGTHKQWDVVPITPLRQKTMNIPVPHGNVTAGSSTSINGNKSNSLPTPLGPVGRNSTRWLFSTGASGDPRSSTGPSVKWYSSCHMKKLELCGLLSTPRTLSLFVLSVFRFSLAKLLEEDTVYCLDDWMSEMTVNFPEHQKIQL